MAQYKLSGFIVDLETGEPLIGATILNVNTLQGCVSNNFGYFNMPLPQKDVELKFSYVGYNSQILKVDANNDSLLQIRLIPGNTLAEIKVKAKQHIEDLPEMGKLEIPMDQIKNLPTVTGEPDLLKAFQLMPGVQGGAEMNNGLFVRGGTPDQNLFLLDDVPLYNVSHLGGLYSVFDPSMVKSIAFYKGGFPARYGGRNSAVIDVRNKEGNNAKMSGEIGFSLMLSKIFLEGPLKEGKSTYAVSVRRSNIDIYSYLYGMISNRDYFVGYTFYDINGKTNLYLSPTDRLIINLYNGRDSYHAKGNPRKSEVGEYEYQSKFRQKWGNSVVSARWQHIQKNHIFRNITLAYTKYHYSDNVETETLYKVDNSESSDFYNVSSGVRNLISKVDYEIPIGLQQIKTGLGFEHQRYNPTSISYANTYSVSGSEEQEVELKNPLYANLWYAYGEYIFFHKNISGNVGMRLNAFTVPQKSFYSFQPRFVFNYKVANHTSIKASGGKMQQNIHLITNSNIGLPRDIWIPSTKNIYPESSVQFALGVAHTHNDKIEVTIEAYQKWMKNLVGYKEGVLLYSENGNWDEKITTGGVGNIKGIETLIQKKQGRLTGWIGYTLSKNTREFEDVNSGKPYAFKYDQRHDFSIVSNYQINKKWSFSATWVYRAGHAITLPSGKYTIHTPNYHNVDGNLQEFTEIHLYTEKNGYRMPNYHRLDIGWSHTKKKLKGTAIWNWGIYNVYNRQNAYYLFFKTKDGVVKLYQQSVFPIFINFGYTYQF